MDAIHFVQQYAKILANVDRWLDKAVEFAAAKKFDADTLAQARLAPDQYPLARQVQAACDAAKYSAAYLTGTDAPSHPDTEKTIGELKARIRTCLAYLESIKAEDVEGWADRRVSPKWLGGKWVKGEQFLLELSLPNFYFHATTAYEILRHNGVDLGKMDFLGGIPTHE